ncbi:BON domain-containing protein [Variovorax sp. KK3]|uniref:BON domain-containing protein n=1 Tax=Variovorax sp. KK3 TaxID=1855728 RepID=UPI0009FAB64F|nr:BON domain-containing protein [Variovorax sp. KK3]
MTLRTHMLPVAAPRSLRRLPATVLLAGVLTLSLAGCGPEANKEQARQNIDNAVDKTEKATAAAANKAADLAEKARDNTVSFFKSAEVKQDVEAAKQAVKNAGAELGSKTNDTALTVSVSAAIARDPELGPRNIDVASHGGTVQLSGSAPSAAAKTRAEQIARTVNGVDAVDNRIAVTATQ